MKAAMFYGGKDIRVETVPDPVPGPGEALIRVRAAAVCGSDLHHYHDDVVWDPPRIRGHELAGEVAGLGPGVTGLQVGQRVGIEPLWTCNKCEWCMSGQQYHCADWRSIGVYRPGGFAQYTIAAENLCHPLPDNVSFDAAALLDVYACATHALALVPVNVGQRVVVIGSGAVGIALAEMSNLAGAGAVAMLGRRAAALDFAQKVTDVFPIDVTAGDPVEAVMEWTGGRGADIVFEAVGGKQQTLAWAVQMAARGGRVGIEGAYTELQTIDARRGLTTELAMFWIQSYDRRGEQSEYDITRDLVAAGKINPDAIVTHHFPLDQIVEAFEAANNRAESGAVRIVMQP